MKDRKALSDADQKLWDYVTQDIQALPHKRARKNVPKPLTAQKIQTLAAPKETQKSTPKRTAPNLAKANIRIEARLDLHGKTQAEAHKALIKFILSARKKGVCVALIITGKGAGGAGVLKRTVPLWLEAPDMADHIVQYAEARAQDGGTGALYVLIRKL